MLTVGETPCLVSEIGIPYDMDNKRAHRDGNYLHQYLAMDANNYALEQAGLSYTLWNYCPDVSPAPAEDNFRIIIFGGTFGMGRILVFGVKQTST